MIFFHFQSNKTQGFILTLHLKNESYQLLPEIRNFCIYAEENKLHFSSAGLFSITRSQLGMVINERIIFTN